MEDKPCLEVIEQHSQSDESYQDFVKHLHSDVADLFWLADPARFGRNHMGACIVEKATGQIAAILVFYNISLARPNVLKEEPGLYHVLVKGAWRPKYAHQLRSFMGAFVQNIFGKEVPHALVEEFFPTTELRSVKFWVQSPSTHSSYDLVKDDPPPEDQLMFVQGILQAFSKELFIEQQDPSDPLANFQVEPTEEEIEQLRNGVLVPFSRPGIDPPEMFYAVRYDVAVAKEKPVDGKLEACARTWTYEVKALKRQMKS